MEKSLYPEEPPGDLIDTAPEPPPVPEPDFVKLEKNLSSLGFFSPTSKTLKGHRAKTVQLTRLENRTRITARVTIEPSVSFGLPTTAHQDKTFAFQKIIQDRQTTGEKITNPVGFTSAEMLRLLGLRVDAGKNYNEIDEWLNVMTATLIISEGAVFFAGSKAYAKDRFHVFDRAVSFGKEMPDGTVADRNYVWLSDWQLENINNFHYLPIDFETYKCLRNPIAKTLVPLLQVWFYASHARGIFEKRYDEFCQQLGLREYQYPSKIREKLSPALDELKEHTYLAAWAVEETDGGFKIVLRPGLKYYEDRRLLAERKYPTSAIALAPAKQRALPAALAIQPTMEMEVLPEPTSSAKEPTKEPEADAVLIETLMGQGLSQEIARRLAAAKPQECWRQLEYLPFQNIKGSRAGFLRRAIEAEGGYGEPPGFAEKRQEQARAAQEKARQEAQKAHRAAILERLRGMAEALINEAPTSVLEPLLAFMRERRDRDLRFCKPGTKPYEAITAAYTGEPLQLELILEFYAQNSCPTPELADLIREQGFDRLKMLIRAHYESN